MNAHSETYQRSFGRRSPPPSAIVDRATFVTFTLGEDIFAIPVESVERVLRYTAASSASAVTPVGSDASTSAAASSIDASAPWFEGVIEHRGRIVSVVDLRARLGRERHAPTRATRIIVLATWSEWLAAVVDTVNEVIVVDARAISAPPALVRGLPGEYFLGMVAHRNGVVLILDMPRVLSARGALSLAPLAPAVDAREPDVRDARPDDGTRTRRSFDCL